VREGMVLQGDRPKGVKRQGPSPLRARVTVPRALFGDKVVTSIIVVTYDIFQPSLAWWLGEPELGGGRA
jgi:hypothetical protein